MSHKMLKSIVILCLLVIVCAKPDDSNSSESDSDEENCPGYCVGKEYRCKEGYCYCKAGYVPNPTHNRCVRCPGLGQRCYGRCCDTYEKNRTLTCWNGVCAVCHAQESQNTWMCRDPYYESVILISSTQIVMGTALILGIIATFVLIYKLCAVTGSRPLGSGTESRLSIGSLQLYVDERLRDAPPRYSRTAPSVPTILVPSSSYINAGFVHDSSVPPPPYTLNKDDNHPNSTIYM